MLKKLLVIVFLGSFISCTQKQEVPDQRILEIIKDNPETLMEVLEENKVQLAEIVEAGLKEKIARAREKSRADRMEKRFDPDINPDRPYLGERNAPFTIVEYSNFLCTYCAKGATTMRQLLYRYPDQVRIFYKHQPFSNATGQLAALYFEAVALQDDQLAWVFHDTLFKNQQELAEKGELFLVEAAAELEVDMKQLAEDVKSEKVKAMVESDMREADTFGIKGTPSFLVNGVKIEGAQPITEFEEVMRLLAPDIMKETQGQAGS